MQRRRNFWGWGWADFQLDPKTTQATLSALPFLLGLESVPEYRPVDAPKAEQISLRAPRFSIAKELEPFCTDDKYHRLSHTYGKCFIDIVKGLLGQFDNPPDYVAFPRSESELQLLAQFATTNRVALIPYGGGSTVARGVEGPTGKNYVGFISVDMSNLNRIIEVNKEAHWIHVEAGLYGPDLESALKEHNLTLRHFPQSFEFSTVGGWVATRGQGHFATVHTHIDDFVEGVRVVSPSAIFQSRHLPASGAGPSLDRLMTGSEGIFGFITQVWLKCLERPRYRASTTVTFEKFDDGVTASRKLAQSGLNPAQCRLVDEKEAFMMGLGSGDCTVLLLGFESVACDQLSRLREALSICKESHGEYQDDGIHITQSDEGEREGAAGEWRKSFLAAPYLRDELIRHGFISETYETAVTWDRFPQFHQAMIARVQEKIKEVCDGYGIITCRFTAVYQSGVAPYYTVLAWCGDHTKMIEKWEAIKKVSGDVIHEFGATITHHHSVGRYHMEWYKKEIPPFYSEIMGAVKRQVDPAWIMNPGVLLDEPGLNPASKL